MKSRPSDSWLCKLSSTWCFKIIRRTARRCRKTIHAFHSWQQATHFYYITCFRSYYLTGAHCRYFGMWWREDWRKYQWLRFTCWWELNYWFCARLKPTCDLPSWHESKRACCDAGLSLTVMSKVGNGYIFLQPPRGSVAVSATSDRASGERQTRRLFHHAMSAFSKSCSHRSEMFLKTLTILWTFWKCTAAPQNRQGQLFSAALAFGAPHGSSLFILR